MEMKECEIVEKHKKLMDGMIDMDWFAKHTEHCPVCQPIMVYVREIAKETQEDFNKGYINE